MNVKRETCAFCEKAVYFSERASADDKVFHKACFRCEECKTMLSLGKYASMSGRTFCKPCFKKMFLTKGNYSEGFGTLKPQHEFESKRSPAGSPAPTKKEPEASASVAADASASSTSTTSQ
eukprot:TRINITY_DN2687_c0_g2_i1.p1 TRINITY_DN2687_c0_g2~~TRINITY_DN2687_c0_g2_i1.p1  ORF type:complete len:121 (+),score=22.08 TRINITY_DN2687_c0_g2_i1:140-502(+)